MVMVQSNKPYKKRKYEKEEEKQKVQMVPAKPSLYKMTQKALYLSKKALQQSTEEWKYHDYYVNHNIPGSVYTVCLNQIPIGTYAYQRVGDKVKMKRLTVRLNVSINPSATDTEVRLIIIYSKRMKFMPIGAFDELYQYDSIYSPKKIDRKDEQITLFDQMFTMSMVYQPRQFQVIKSFDLKDKPLEYASGTTNLEVGGLYIIVKGNELTNVPYLLGYTRLYFTE